MSEEAEAETIKVVVNNSNECCSESDSKGVVSCIITVKNPITDESLDSLMKTVLVLNDSGWDVHVNMELD